MNSSLTQKLIDAFPALYRHPLEFGFEYGDGWFGLLLRSSEQLSENASAIDVTSGDYPCAIQVKQKFGQLRWYGENLSDAMESSIEAAAKRSLEVCEICGTSGKLEKRKGWYSVRCDAHVSQ